MDSDRLASIRSESDIPSKRKATIETQQNVALTGVTKELTLLEIHQPGIDCTITVTIDDDGSLRFDGYDVGKDVVKWFGHDDYEYHLSVDSQHKDSILLYLIKDRFETDSEFREWLSTKGIPSRFSSY